MGLTKLLLIFEYYIVHVYEKIKFSNIRNIYLYIRFLLYSTASILKIKNPFWSISYVKQSNNLNNKRILLFLPSMNLDKPSYLNVGLRLFINSGKKNNVNFTVIQCNNSIKICHLGGSPYKANNRMPCKSCIKVNSKLYDDLDRVFLPNIKINHEANLKKLEFEELLNYEYKNYELGKLVHSSVIWIKRDSNLTTLDKDYFVSMLNDAINLLDYFESCDLEKFDGILVFNGLSFPESILYSVCKKNNLNVATFEGGFVNNQKCAIEFNYGFTSQHFFKFNPELIDNKGCYELKQKLLKKSKIKKNFELPSGFKNAVAIFGNVTWDTTQFISNSIYTSKYEWLSDLENLALEYPETLFLFRAHPGENRDLKKTYYGLSEWFKNSKLNNLDNAIMFSADSGINSYQIIEKVDLVLVYNSTIGIESCIKGKKTFAAANSHYLDNGFITSFSNKLDFIQMVKFTLSNKDFKYDSSKSDLALSYYYQLLESVSYKLDEFVEDQIQLKLYDEFSIGKKELYSEEFDVLLDKFLNKKNLMSSI